MMVWLLRAVVVLVVLVVQGVAARLVAQDGPGTPRATVKPVPPVPVQNPVDYFRQLLAAKGVDRDQLLSSRRPEQRAQFLEILREYERLVADEREKRLQALELRFQITSILRLPAASRTQAMARLPERTRPLVKERLDYWNQLAPDVQRVLLENERLIRIFTVVPVGRVAPAVAGGTLNSNELGRVEAAVRNWNRLPEGKRVAAEEAFERMFGSGSAGAGAPLSPSERDEMQRALNRFKVLNPAQRSRCIRNFGKLAGMSAEDRQEFLRSAEEWRRMSPEDRQAWRDIVKGAPVLPPPLPGFNVPPMPVPVLTPKAPVIQAATNTN